MNFIDTRHDLDTVFGNIRYQQMQFEFMSGW